MPLLAMFIARAMMVLALVGSVSMYFYLHILRHSPFIGHQQDAYVPPPPFQWDRADRRNIIIVTNTGFDSNILGKLFNEHPRVFYMEQPLYPFEMFKTLNYTRNAEYSGQVRAFLDNLFQCRFNGYKDYLTFLSYPLLASPHYRLSSKALSSPPLCKEEVVSYTDKFLEMCPIMQPKWVSHVCAARMHVVISILSNRAPGGELGGLLPLMTSESMAIRVLYLVKDPRASMWEMLSKSVSTKEKKDSLFSTNEKIKDFCDNLGKEVYFFETLSDDLRKQYQLVRYEEALQNVVGSAQLAFKFAGITFEPSVRIFSEVQNLKVTNFDKPFSWRMGIDVKTVSAVEAHCARVMNTLGYARVGGNVKQLRDLDFSLLTHPKTSHILKRR